MAIRQAAFSQWNNGHSIRTPGYRHTEWGTDGADGMELYDHNADPAEMNNVADDPAYRDASRRSGHCCESESRRLKRHRRA